MNTWRVIVAGTIGAGKSTLLDMLHNNCTQSTFLAAPSAASQTQVAQSVTCADPDDEKRVVTLVDVPGLADITDDKADANYKQLIGAVHKDELHVFLMIVSPVNGRLSSADVEAYRQLTRGLDVRPRSILGIVNQSVDMHAADKTAVEYRSDMLKSLDERDVRAHSWVFVPHMDCLAVRHDAKHELDVKHVGKCECARCSTISVQRNRLWQSIRLLDADHCKILQEERDTADRLAKQAAELNAQKEKEAADHAQAEAKAIADAAELKRQAEVAEAQRQADLALAQQQANAQAEQHRINEAARKHAQDVLQQQQEATIKANADALAAQLAQQQAERDRADAVLYPVPCEYGERACRRVFREPQWTVGMVREHVRVHGKVPYANCKPHRFHQHEPRVDGDGECVLQ